MLRREGKNTALVYCGEVYTGPTLFRLGSREWFAWVGENGTFYYQSSDDFYHFTARRELRSGLAYWYAFRTWHKKTYKSYLGKAGELTADRLQAVAVKLAKKCGAS